MTPPFHLFERFGVELEYMVVDRATLRVRPVVDRVLQNLLTLPGAKSLNDDGVEWPDEVELGPVTIGNELALHVLELKTTTPARSLSRIDEPFAAAVSRVNTLLARDGAMLLPTGMHPTMDPNREMKLWPHDRSPIYEAFDRIFDCTGHGWANLQAAHLNLPFADDADGRSEFARLHAAIRLVLPILPALSASSPVKEGVFTGILDSRLDVYRGNSARIPITAGKVIPEAVFTRDEYDREIFQRIYKAFEPFDPEGVLRHEWCNSRGAIARFSRNTIEIRVLDVQECPRADAAILAGVTAVLRGIIAGDLGDSSRLRAWAVEPLHDILLKVIRAGDLAVIDNAEYLATLGITHAKRCTAGEIWQHLFELVAGGASPDGSLGEYMSELGTILREGCLARRIVHALGKSPSREKIDEVYRELAGCLAQNRLFRIA